MDLVTMTYGSAVVQMLPDAPVPEPTPITVLSVLSLKRRLTPTERIAIRARAQTDTVAEDFLDLLNSAGSADLVDPDLQAGLSYLESKGDLAAGRAAEVLGAPVLPGEMP